MLVIYNPPKMWLDALKWLQFLYFNDTGLSIPLNWIKAKSLISSDILWKCLWWIEAKNIHDGPHIYEPSMNSLVWM